MSSKSPLRFWCLLIAIILLRLVTSGGSIAERSVAPPNVALNTTCEDDNPTGSPLRSNYYEETCPETELIVFSWVVKAVYEDPRMAASLLRLHFHDCFVNGCDASVLLDDTGSLVGEKTALPNLNSLRGFEVIDAIKSELESVCPHTVSCADILAIAARDSVVISKGPFWEVPSGRKDCLTASKAAANSNIPAPNSTLSTLVSMFQNLGLGLSDMVALSGAHTLGKARCTSFSSRLTTDQSNNGGSPPNVNLDFLLSLQQLCSSQGATTSLADLDLVTPSTFDNQYYANLLSGEGLLGSDQILETGDQTTNEEGDSTAVTSTREIVTLYAQDQAAFFEDFRRSMIKMGQIGVLTADDGEIRSNCRAVN